MSIKDEIDLDFEIKGLREILDLRKLQANSLKWYIKSHQAELEKLKDELDRIEHQIVRWEDMLDDMKEKRRGD